MCVRDSLHILFDFFCNGLGILLFFSNTIIAVAIVFTQARTFQRLGGPDGTLSPGIPWESNITEIVRCFILNT